MATYPQYANVTIGAGGAGHTVSISGAGTGAVLTSNGTNATTWASTSASNNAKITAQGQLHIEGKDADIVMNGVSLKEILNGITDRLSILQPKPELLAKYENLRLAYEHYKTLEALLHEDNNGQ
jgi:shikimate 5-dehydrogenase